LPGSVRPKQNKLNKGASNMIKSPVVWFCSDFQKKICSFSGSHDKVVKGVTRHVKHNNLNLPVFSLSFLHAVIISISPATNWLYFKSSNLIFLFAILIGGNLEDVWFFVLMV
jgi:hypothetical protein